MNLGREQFEMEGSMLIVCIFFSYLLGKNSFGAQVLR